MMMLDHRAACGGVWCVNGLNGWQIRSARCGKCGIVVMSAASWAHVDPSAFDQAVDPNGRQREFLRACGMTPTRPKVAQ